LPGLTDPEVRKLDAAGLIDLHKRLSQKPGEAVTDGRDVLEGFDRTVQHDDIDDAFLGAHWIGGHVCI
jgi:hypothetical protein